MNDSPLQRIIDLEWPTRYLLACGHDVAIAPDASVADMAMPGAELPCLACGGAAPANVSLLTYFKAGEAINALSLNSRLVEIERCLARSGKTPTLTHFTADEPINAHTLNRRLEEIAAVLG